MPSQRKPLSVRLPPPDEAELRDYAKANGMSLGEVVLSALREFFSRKKGAE